MFFIAVIIFIIIISTSYVIICRYNWEKLTKESHCNPVNEHQSHSNKQVVIVGAGVCGIAAAKTFLQYGYRDLVILERSEELGGVWNSSQYEG